MYCPQCGAQLDDDAKFCSSCGASVPTNTPPDELQAETEVTPEATETPFTAEAAPTSDEPSNDSESNQGTGFQPVPPASGTVSRDDLVQFVGPNAEKYLRKWGTDAPESKVVWHWPAFFFGPFWSAYRKMYWFLLVYIVLGLVNLVTRNPFSSVFSLIIAILYGLFAYSLYYRHARSKIAKITAETSDPVERLEKIRRAGGNSPLALVLTIIGYFVFIVVVSIITIIGLLAANFGGASNSLSSMLSNSTVVSDKSSSDSSSSTDPASAGASVKIGTSYDENSDTLAVSGTDYTVSSDLYCRVETPSGEDAFNTTTLTFRLEEKNGQGWESLDSLKEDVNPEWNVYVEQFQVPEAGTYRVYVLKDGKVYGSTEFTVNE